MEPVAESDLYVPIWWNVGFVSRKNKYWWDFLLKDHFKHCFAYGYLAHIGHWIVINPAHEKTQIAVVRDDLLEEYIDLIAGQGLTLVQIKGAASPIYAQRILQNCSTVIARVIGVKGNALTPAMLFKTLMSQNAKLKADPYNVYKSQSPRGRS